MRCLVIRHGAYGDVIMASCVLPYLRRDGYEITFYTNTRGKEVLQHNPHIKGFIEHKDDSIPIQDLDEHYDKVARNFDRTVCFTGNTIENEMLWAFPQKEYFLSHEERRKLVGNKNYYDLHLWHAGYKPKRPQGELYFSKEEKAAVSNFKRDKHFNIVWALSGSSVHKAYRYFEPVARAFLDRHKDAWIYTVGDYVSKLLTFQHERVVNTMHTEISFREAMILAKYGDLVIGPETGLMLAAGCFKTPKICLLTHSGKSQLTKYWDNDYSMQAECECSPCHLLHKYKTTWQDVCELDDMGFPACRNHDPQKLLGVMEDVYVQSQR